MTVSRAVSPWRLTSCLSSLLAASKTWRYDSSRALRLISRLPVVNDTFHTVSAYVTFMFPLWQLQTASLEIHLVFLSKVWFKTLGPDLLLCLWWPPLGQRGTNLSSCPGSPHPISSLNADMFIPSGGVIYPLYCRGTTVAECHHKELVWRWGCTDWTKLICFSWYTGNYTMVQMQHNQAGGFSWMKGSCTAARTGDCVWWSWKMGWDKGKLRWPCGNLYTQTGTNAHLHTHIVHTQGSKRYGLHRLRRPSCRGPRWGEEVRNITHHL